MLALWPHLYIRLCGEYSLPHFRKLEIEAHAKLHAAHLAERDDVAEGRDWFRARAESPVDRTVLACRIRRVENIGGFGKEQQTITLAEMKRACVARIKLVRAWPFVSVAPDKERTVVVDGIAVQIRSGAHVEAIAAACEEDKRE